MTMETYRWQRVHLTTPELAVSIMRRLPEGDWIVRAENWTLPPQSPTTYDTLEGAMRGADEAARTEHNHECSTSGCGKWMPVPPTSE